MLLLPKSILSSFLLIFIFGFHQIGYSQDTNRAYRFNVSVSYVGHNFYEGGPLLKVDNPFSENKKYLKYQYRYQNGASISFRISRKSSLKANYNHVSYSYNGRGVKYHGQLNSNQEANPGDITGRYLKLYSLDYSYLITTNKIVNVDLTAGGVYRNGNEYYTNDQGNYYEQIHISELQDFGAYFGVSAYRDLLKSRLRLRASLTHTEFFYRHDTGDKTDYDWDEGSNKRMLQFAFSLGYNFGQIPFE